MRPAHAALLLPLGLLGCATAGTDRASVPDQDWAGRLRCDLMPAALSRTLNQEVRLEVRAGVAHMGRDVRVPDTAINSGFREAVEGRVGPAGDVTLTGQGYSRSAGYGAEYKGRLPQAGGAAELVGVQQWHFARLPPFQRACTLSLHRVG